MRRIGQMLDQKRLVPYRSLRNRKPYYKLSKLRVLRSLLKLKLPWWQRLSHQ